jgi:precorrin-2 dehydrogenase / sirohydrochlorin ferrochelatase
VNTYPIFIIGLESRKVIVIGGGFVAARKVQTLHDDGASVTVISPEIVPALAELAAAGALSLQLRQYQEGDLKGAFMAIAATDDPEVNRSVWEEAVRERCLINVVDDPSHSNFITPAVVRRGKLKLAITTGGASPALARILRMKLEKLIGPEYEELVELLDEWRPEFINRFQSMEARFLTVDRLLEAGLLDLVRQQGRSAANKLIEETVKK